MQGSVRLTVDDGVGVIRLDRAPANVFDLSMGLELEAAVRDAASDDEVGAIVVHGGPKLFAAGADIKAMATWGPEEVRPSVDALGAACDLVERVEKLSFAAISGVALGGGLELALACDVRYMADDARIGQPEIKLGVIPGAGGTQRLTRLAGLRVARDLVFSGRQVPADEALALGLADRVLPAADVLDAALGDARAAAAGPRLALGAAKAALLAAVETPGPEGIRAERERFLALFGTSDQREGMRAFLEKREPRFGP